MVTRTQRLKQLLELQEQLKAVHEMRRATFLANAAQAARDAAEILERRSGDDSLSDLFPDVYSRFVDKAVARRQDNETLAEKEAMKVALETARTNMVERSFRASQRDDDRKAEERAGLEAVERMRKPD